MARGLRTYTRDQALEAFFGTEFGTDIIDPSQHPSKLSEQPKPSPANTVAEPQTTKN